MNEHIKALAKEHFCSTEFNDGTVHECYEFSEVELAKFAELIVKECINTVDSLELSIGPFVTAVIKEHFGVE